MKLLAVLFLVGFALSAAVPVPSHDLSFERADDIKHLLIVLEADGDDEVTDQGKTLREHLDELLEKVQDLIDHGKTVKDNYLERIKQIRQKLKDMREDIGDHARELLQKIKEKGKDYFRKILEKIGLGKRDAEMYAHAILMEADEDGGSELGKKLREHLDDLLEKIKDAIDHGKNVKEDYIEKIKQLREKLKEMKEDIGTHAKELLEKIKEKGRDWLKKILEKLGLNDKRSIELHAETILMEADEDGGSELGKKLREHLDDLLEKIKDAIDHGKNVKEDYIEKIKQLREKLKEMKEDIGTHAKELLERIKEKGRDWLKKILEKLGLNDKRSIELHAETILMEAEDESDLAKKLKEKFEEIVQKIKDALENGKSLQDGLEKLKELRQKLKDLKVDLGEKGKELIKKLREKVRDYFNKLLEKLGKDRDRRSIKEVYERIRDYLKKIRIELKEKFTKFGEWAVTQYEKGLEKGKDKAESLQKLAREFINDAKNLSREVVDQAKEFFHEYKDDLGNVYNDVVDKIKEVINKN